MTASSPVSEKSSWKRGLRVVQIADSGGTTIDPAFQRKAHEKEDWESRTASRPSWSLIMFQRKAHEKEDWERGVPVGDFRGRGAWFQRKAHEKEDWEIPKCLHRIVIISYPFGFREKLMKKRIESFLRFWFSGLFPIRSFREKLMKKRIERRGVLDKNSSQITAVSEKSSWKRGLRVSALPVLLIFLIIFVSEKSSWKRGLRENNKKVEERVKFSRFREKLMKKRIERC